ncbi:hypothetical protein VTG60DRAFT_6598 [Thermothelomyces hinnuleus]
MVLTWWYQERTALPLRLPPGKDSLAAHLAGLERLLVSLAAQVVVLGNSDDKLTPPRTTRRSTLLKTTTRLESVEPGKPDTTAQGFGHATSTFRKLQSPDSRVEVAIRSILFDWVPTGLIDAYVTGSGEWTDSSTSKCKALFEIRSRGEAVF